MNINLSIPFTVLRTWMFMITTIAMIFFVLLPTSLLTYLHFQHTILPQAPIRIPLDFTYTGEEFHGPYSLVNLTEFDNELKTMWNGLNRNRFTKLKHTVMLNIEYINLSYKHEIGSIRTTLINKPKTIPYNKKNGFPFINSFPKLTTNRDTQVLEDIYDKSMQRSVLFSSYGNSNFDENSETSGLFDYLLPNWVQNLFIPVGFQKLLKWSSLKSIFGRSNSQIFDVQFSSFQSSNLPNDPNFLSLELVKLDSKSIIGKLKQNSLLVELDLHNVFINRGSLTFEWEFEGLRNLIYWWPGVCFFIGVGFLWSLSSACCVIVSLMGYGYIELFGGDKTTEKAKRDIIAFKNLQIIKESKKKSAFDKIF